MSHPTTNHQDPYHGPGHISVGDIRQVFRRADCGGKGYLTRADFLVAMVGLLGYEPSEWELQHSCKDVDIDQCEMDLRTFTSLILRKLGPHHASTTEEDASIRHAFLAADAGCRGFLTPADLRSLFATVAPTVPPAVVDEAFVMLDRNRCGRITYREFEEIMKCRT
ncbi:hypothetical protein DFJ77DRAFT_452177 [Powellomyces hirtus]|nr:hypothetical protein DFJ77DRAFT_452177 [Powellomyces hirtus]